MQDFIYFLLAHRQEMLMQTLQHLRLTLLAMFFAIGVGLCLGIVLVRYPRWAGGVFGGLGIIQTIPSLALLGFMLPLLGIGALPAVIALFLYALLPIVRNTFTGIRQVDAAVTEAAKGMGLSTNQRLRWVELPLALPTIFAGIRTAVVISVGVATLCALIAAGGLGEFIFKGIALNNTNMVLAGAIPAALLAVLLDALLALLQRNIHRVPLKSVLIFTFILVGLVALAEISLTMGAAQRDFVFGFDAEFAERGDGFKGLRTHYAWKKAVKVVELDAGLMYQALKESQLDVIGGYTTDGRIQAFDLKILTDDHAYFPPYYVAPLVSQATLRKYPVLKNILAKLAGKISNETMQNLNYAVDEHKKDIRSVAAEFLKGQGLLAEVPKYTNQAKGTIKIGGKKFTEQYILLHIFKQLIEHHTQLHVELKEGLGGTQIAFEALRKGEIDLYPEYTGTGLFVILQAPPAVYQPILRHKEKVFEYVNNQTIKRYQLQWLAPLGFNNSYALMMRKAQAKQLNIETISDLKGYLYRK
jgi:osmoprotectant transport system permease protein